MAISPSSPVSIREKPTDQSGTAGPPRQNTTHTSNSIREGTLTGKRIPLPAKGGGVGLRSQLEKVFLMGGGPPPRRSFRRVFEFGFFGCSRLAKQKKQNNAWRWAALGARKGGGAFSHFAALMFSESTIWTGNHRASEECSAGDASEQDEQGDESSRPSVRRRKSDSIGTQPMT